MTRQRIYVGITEDNELYYIEIEPKSENHKYFAMSGSTIAPIEAVQGEQEAKERLEDGELWKMAVESGHTTLGLDDWVELVLSTDGWESQFDFDYDISPTDYDGKEYHWDNRSGGQHEESKFKHLFISQELLTELQNLWKEYHLKEAEPTIPTINQDKNEILTKALEVILE